MGIIYKAQDLKLDRVVALKFLPQHLLNTEEEKTRFLHEAKAASALNHPNITTLYDIYEEEGEIFIAMECIEGDTLKDKLEQGPFKLKELLGIAIQLAEGLQGAHEAGIVHRDIKTENVMICKNDQAKILDFGLAKRKGMSKITKNGSTLGTLAYMSPEQVEGLYVDHRSDLWSLGVVLYEMATGRKPFEEDHEAAVLYSIMNEEPLPVLTLNPNVPQELGRIIHKALEKEANNRYQHADDLVADLRRLQKDREASKSTVSKTYTTISKQLPVKPSWRMTIIAARAISIVFVASFIYVILNREVSEAPAPKINPKSIAVLPFTSITRMEEDEIFTEGIHDDILTQLSKIKDLKVISRTSVMKYKNTGKNIREIGTELSVASVLEGTVRRVENRVRIAAQLIDTKTDENIWAETYDRNYVDIFAIQSDVAIQIAAALKTTLAPAEKRYIEYIPTEKLDAYNNYSRGNVFFYKGNVETALTKAIQYYAKAIELDPIFTLAYAKLSYTHMRLYWFGFDHTNQRLQQAKAALDYATVIDPDLPDVHFAQGIYYYYGFRDFDRALKEFNMALKAQPNNSELLAAASYIQRRQGDWEGSVKNGSLASVLDPYSTLIPSQLALTYIYLRNWEKANWYVNRSIMVDSTFLEGYSLRAWISIASEGDVDKARMELERHKKWINRNDFVNALYTLELFSHDYTEALRILEEDQEDWFIEKAFLLHFMGDNDEAIVCFDSARIKWERLIIENPENGEFYSTLGLAYAGLGRKQEAVEFGKFGTEFIPLSLDAMAGPRILQNLAFIYTIVDEHDQALDLIEYLLSIPSFITRPLLRIDPFYDPLRDHPRFQKLLASG